MKLDPFIAVLVTVLVAAVPTLDGAGAEAFQRTSLPSCTSEMQRCLDKLDRRLDLSVHRHDWSRIESAYAKLLDTDPECVLLLQGTGLRSP